MSKKHIFRPEYDFKTVRDITDAIFQKYRLVLFDLDNTIAPYERPVPNEIDRELFCRLSRLGIDFAFISNNKPCRLKTYCEGTDWFYISEAGKPSPKGVLECIKHFGKSTGDVLCVGDQLLTDCLAAHRAGVDFCLVEPINDRTDLFFKFKRAIERPILKRYRRTVKK